MKKPKKYNQIVLVRRQRKIKSRQIIKANKEYNRRLKQIRQKPKAFSKRKLHKLRQLEVAKKIHSSFQYSKGRHVVTIEGEFGLEEPSTIPKFIELANQTIDFNTQSLHINIENATRIWPSGLTLLCSLKEWVEIGSRYQRISHPLISSSNAKSDKVNSYLNHSGFHDYVGRKKSTSTFQYNSNDIVRIKREKNQSNAEVRENEIIELINNKCNFSPNDSEWFNDVVLTEVFHNVDEHGIVNYDQGWWILAQFHPTHKFVSLCIADNGIGIKNSLLSGPQHIEILDELKKHQHNEGNFIKLALEENVSGAYNASLRNAGFLGNKYARGARRGNGLKRIKDKCAELEIRFSILSHFGYLFLDEKGNEYLIGSTLNRVFAGTLYNFIIPVRS